MILSSATLPKLASTKVSLPTYDRSKVKPGILHIGLGNFHRAHMAAYIDDLMENSQDDSDLNWGIVGAGLLHFDQAKRDLLKPQDWLQTLVVRDADTTTARILGSMIDFLEVSPEAILKTLEEGSIRIVSLTVTEGGYFLNDGKFDAENPQIQQDIKTPDAPKTVFGILVKALKKCKEKGTTPFTVMSCDNIPHNGDIAKSAVLGLASHIDSELAKWIEANVGFPNAMVDRITPATTDKQRDFVKTEYGLTDASPVFCEPFRQWVLEDDFPGGRPKLEALENVKFVPSVKPYEFMKIRILNGGHATLCYPSALLGLKYVHEAMEHPTIGPFLDALERNEIIPTVPPVPDTDLLEYWKIIGHRFTNPTLNDTIDRNCYDGASRQPKFIVPVILDNLEAGRSIDGVALVSAMWCRYCQGLIESGEVIPDNDPQWDRLQKIALTAKDDPSLWLDGLKEIYGNIAANPIFQQSFEKAMKSIVSDGVDGAMRNYIEATKK